MYCTSLAENANDSTSNSNVLRAPFDNYNRDSTQDERDAAAGTLVSSCIAVSYIVIDSSSTIVLQCHLSDM
jgi:hypothetical protein